MSDDIVISRKVIKKDNYDVVVVGGGIAGISAAVASARKGAKTLIIEKGIILGGLATAGLISFYEPLCDGKGQKMQSSIGEELLQLSIKYGYDTLPDIWKTGDNRETTDKRYETHFSPGIFALALDEYIQKNGVKVIFDTMFTYPVMNGNKCEGIVAEAKEGQVFYGAKVVIDATGDADVFARANAPTKNGENFLSFVAHGINIEINEKIIKNPGKILPQKWFSMGSNLLGEGHPEGIKKIAGLDSEEITQFVLMGRKLLFDRLKSQDRYSRDITALPSVAQFRTTRRIIGEKDFNVKDREICNDSVGSCGDFRPNGQGRHYHVPFGTLYNRNYPNLIAAGRIISAPQGDGWEVSRVIPVCALTGQAAGTAAALASNSGEAVCDIDISKLQAELKKDGVIFFGN